jgi:hypothetical protein
LRGRTGRDTPWRMKQILLIPALALTLYACGKPDEAALTKGDDAFKGQMVDGELRAVAARPVMIGEGGGSDRRGALACARMVTLPDDASIAVHWSSAVGPVKAEVGGEVWACEVDDAWTGVIFPAFGQGADNCRAAERLASPREYQGPCRWGWVETAVIAAAAG